MPWGRLCANLEKGIWQRPPSEKSRNASSTHSAAEIDEAQNNLEKCLEAYDQGGDAALEKELKRIHPSPGRRLKRIALGPPFEGAYSKVLVDENGKDLPLDSLGIKLKK